MKTFMRSMFLLLFAVACSKAYSAVNYEAGILTIEGVQVFQDADNSSHYYYLPQYPRIVTAANGDLDFLFMKYTGSNENEGGGLIHALIEFTLDDEVRLKVERKLVELRPGAELKGALPLLESPKDDAYGSFRVVSATLDVESPPDRMTGKVISSGVAPLAPGSRVAIAARLSQVESTILMESIKGATSDLSVAIRGYYEAKVLGYNAIVRANMDTVYSHNSVVDNVTSKFTKREARRVVDELHQDGALEITVHDATASVGLDAESLSGILNIVTDKLLEVMFDTETGWSRVPDPEVLLANEQIKGRQEKGFFGKIFGGPEDLPYFSDDQYVLKKREDVRSNRFFLNLSQSTVIRIPFNTTGNLGGFYDALSDDDREKYFQFLYLDEDEFFQYRDYSFIVDGNTAKEFSKTFNFVSVVVRKRKSDGLHRTETFILDGPDIESGTSTKVLTFVSPRGAGADSEQIDYRVNWSFLGDREILEPAQQDEWITTTERAITLRPPLRRQEVTIQADNSDFDAKGVAAGVVQIMSEVLGEVRLVGEHKVLGSMSEPSVGRVVYHDFAEPLVYRMLWHTKTGERAKTDPRLLSDGLIVAAAPDKEWLTENAE